jgi:hypothetical protein
VLNKVLRAADFAALVARFEKQELSGSDVTLAFK